MTDPNDMAEWFRRAAAAVQGWTWDDSYGIHTHGDGQFIPQSWLDRIVVAALLVSKCEITGRRWVDIGDEYVEAAEWRHPDGAPWDGKFPAARAIQYTLGFDSYTAGDTASRTDATIRVCVQALEAING